MPVNYKNWIQENADATKEITELKSTQKKSFVPLTKMKNSVKNSVGKVTNKFSNKISETVADVKNQIAEMEAERERKNFEKMNELRYNSDHLTDAQLRTFINDSSLDKFERIGYAAAFADRYSDRS